MVLHILSKTTPYRSW